MAETSKTTESKTEPKTTDSKTEPVVAPSSSAGDVVVASENVTVGDPVNSGYVDSETETYADVVVTDTENLSYLGDPKEVDVAYSYLTHNDPSRQGDAYGTYTDDLARETAEIQRARVEGREPDLDNPGPTGGTPLVPTVQAQQFTQPGVISPVSETLPVSVGVPVEEVTGNSAAAEAHGLNVDGTEKSDESGKSASSEKASK